MELYFMAVGILLLTLIASYAIQRAEGEMIEHRDPGRPAQSEPPLSGEQAPNRTKARA